MQPVQPGSGHQEKILLSHGIPLPTGPFNYFLARSSYTPEIQRKPLPKFRDEKLPAISSVIYRQMLQSLSPEKLQCFLKKQDEMRTSGCTEGIEELYDQTFGAEAVQNLLEQTNRTLPQETKSHD